MISTFIVFFLLVTAMIVGFHNEEDLCIHDWKLREGISQCKKCGLIDGKTFWAKLNKDWDKKYGGNK